MIRGRLRTMSSISIGVGALVLLASVTWRCAARQNADQNEPAQLPLPKQFLEAKTLMTKIQQSETLPEAAKNTAAEQFDKIQGELNRLCQPLQEVMNELLTKDKALARDGAALKKDIELHNTKPHLFSPKEPGPRAEYDAEAARLNKKQEDLAAQRKREVGALYQRWQTYKKPLDDWLAGPALQSFNDVGVRLLNHKLAFKKGQAWADLERAVEKGKLGGTTPSDDAASATLGDPFDNRPRQPATSNNPMIVDGRGMGGKDPVVPPEKRSAEIDGLEKRRDVARAKRLTLEARLKELNQVPRTPEMTVEMENLSDRISRLTSEEFFCNYSIRTAPLPKTRP